MKIEVKVDAEQVVKLTAAVVRQLPYAANNAITRTAKEAVDAGKKALQHELTIRKKFVLDQIKILQYSKVGNLTAIIGVNTNVQGSPLLLGFLEEGGVKEPSAGSDIAIPLTGEAARPSFAESVKTPYRYTNLKFVGNQGNKNTYIVPGVGIFQRVKAAGPRLKGAGKVRTSIEIYTFKPSAPLPIHIHLRDAMVAVIGQRFAEIFTEEFTKEILKKAEYVGRS